MAKIDLIDNSWTDLVFEGRNQAYGAYVLRKGTGKRNIWSIIIMLAIAAIIGIIVGAQAIIANAQAEEEISAEVNLSALAKQEAEVEKKAPVEIEKPEVVEQVKSSIKFVPPVIKKDNEVKEDEELKSQDDLSKTETAIGSFDVKGNNEEAGEVLKAKEVIAEPAPKPAEEQIFDVAEVQPEFPGGAAALMKWLSSNITYPAVAQENGISGKVIVGFVVERDGSVSNVRVVRGVDSSLDKEAVSVVKRMPKWMPGKQNGAPVRVKYNVPVIFKLQ